MPFSNAFPAENNNSLQNYVLIVGMYQPRFLATRLRDMTNPEQRLVFIESLRQECQHWETNRLGGSIRRIELLQSQISFFRAAIDRVRNDLTQLRGIIDTQINDLNVCYHAMTMVRDRHMLDIERLDELLANLTGAINTVITDGILVVTERRDQANQQLLALTTAQTLHIQTEAGNRNLQANGNPPLA